MGHFIITVNQENAKKRMLTELSYMHIESRCFQVKIDKV